MMLLLGRRGGVEVVLGLFVIPVSAFAFLNFFLFILNQLLQAFKLEL